LFGKAPNSATRPSVLGILTQASTYGNTIPRIYGTGKSPLYVIWANGLRQSGSDKKLKQKKGNVPTYAINADFLIGSNPIMGAVRAWSNQTGYGLNFIKVTASSRGFAGANPGPLCLGAPNPNLPCSADNPGDPNFYCVVAVTATLPYDVTFNDYGGNGPDPRSGNFDLPLWNAAVIGPDISNPNMFQVDPWWYYWVPGSGPTVRFGPFGGDVVLNIYYAQMTDRGSPLAQLNLVFEPQLGSGPEYLFEGRVDDGSLVGADFTNQQIIYPPYAGTGSPGLDLGASAMMPNLRLEVLGSYGVKPTQVTGAIDGKPHVAADADFTDMIEDIFRMGMSQSDPAQTSPSPFSDIQFGLNCGQRPTVVQKYCYHNIQAFLSGPQPYQLPNTAGNILVVAASGGPSFSSNGVNGDSEIIDDAGNIWIPCFSTAVVGYQMWYCVNCKAFPAGNKVTVNPNVADGDLGGGWNMTLLEITGVDSFDGFVAGGATDSITTANDRGLADFILGFAFYGPGGNARPLNIPHWTIEVAKDSSFTFMSRKVTNPGTYDFVPDQVPQATGLLSFKATEPANFPKPLGNILDYDSLQLTKLQDRAFNLFGDLVMDTQKQAKDWLEDIGIAANAAYVWSGFKLKVIPRSEVSNAGNGAIYIAPTAAGPIASLTPSDFIGSESEAILKIARKAPVDRDNIIQIQHPNHPTAWDAIVTSMPDNAGIAKYGPRKADPKVVSCIPRADVATRIISVMIKRANYIINSYKGKLQAKWKLLEPMDLVLVTEPLLGLFAVPMMIVSVEEDEQFNLNVEFEDYYYAAHEPVVATTTDNQSFVPRTDIDPGSINPPIIFLAVPGMLKNLPAGNYLVYALSGGPDWGGAMIFASSDGTSDYQQIGQQFGKSTMGVLTSPWQEGIDPDFINSLAVDLSESTGALTNFSLTDENNFVSLFYVEGGLDCAGLAQQQSGQNQFTVGPITSDGGVSVGPDTNYVTDVTLKPNSIVVLAFHNDDTFSTTNGSITPSSITSARGLVFNQVAANRASFELDPDNPIDKEVRFITTVFYIAKTGDLSGLDTVTAIAPAALANAGTHTFLVEGTDLDSPVDFANNFDGIPPASQFSNELFLSIKLADASNVLAPASDLTVLGLFGRDCLVSKFAATPGPVAINIAVTGGNFFFPIAPAVQCTLSLKGRNSSGSVGGGIPYELGSYAVADPTTQYGYTILAGGSDSIRRGVYATPIVTHPAGSDFALIDQHTTKIQIDPTWIGKTVFFKFPSFNKFGQHLQQLADCPAYPFTIPLPCSVAIQGTGATLSVDVTAPAPGNFSIPHGLGQVPKLALIEMTSDGSIYFTPVRYDGTNLYLTATDTGVTAKIYVWAGQPGGEIPFTSTVGNFSVTHSLGFTPSVIAIQMTSDGVVYMQSPSADSNHIYLTASEAGLTGYIIAWLPDTGGTVTTPFTSVTLAPTAPDTFIVPHGLGAIPSAVIFKMFSDGKIYFQKPLMFDGTNLYLIASEAGLTGVAQCIG
jgi:hypothetical protein